MRHKPDSDNQQQPAHDVGQVYSTHLYFINLNDITNDVYKECLTTASKLITNLQPVFFSTISAKK